MLGFVVLVAGSAGFLGYCVAIAFRRLLRNEFSDFNVFYFAADALLHHADPYVQQHRSYIYPPLIAFLYTPLALLPKQHAAMILLGLNVLFIALSLVVAAREFLDRLEGPTDPMAIAGVCLLAMLVVPDRIKGELQMFQTNALTLLMCTLALRWLDRRPMWAGAALGLAVNIKYLPIVMLPYLLLRRRWAAATAMFLGIIAFALLPALLSGWEGNLRHLSVAFGGLLHMAGVGAVDANAARIGDVKAGFSLSLTSAVARWLHRAHADALLLPVLATMVIACLGVAAGMYRRNSLPLLRWPGAAEQSAQPFRGLLGLEWAVLTAMALVFSPQTNSRHLVLLLLAGVTLFITLLAPRRGVARLPLLVTALVLPLAMAYPWGGTNSQSALRWRGWFAIGGPSWCILFFCGSLLWVGLQYVSAVARRMPRIEPFALGERHLTEDQLEGAVVGGPK